MVSDAEVEAAKAAARQYLVNRNVDAADFRLLNGLIPAALEAAAAVRECQHDWRFVSTVRRCEKCGAIDA